jgi:hypothetical protein
MLEVREKMSSEERITAPFPSSFDRDLENARVLLEESPWKDSPQKYRKVAEGILRRILTFDPANESAKRLLTKTVETIEIPRPVAEPEKPLPRSNVTNIDVRLTAAKLEMAPKPETPPKLEIVPKLEALPKPEATPAPVKTKVPLPEPPVAQRSVTPPEFSFVVENTRPVAPKEPSRPPWLLVALAALGAIAGLTLLVTHRSTFTQEYPAKVPIAPSRVVQASTAVVPPVVSEASNSTAVPEQPGPPSVPADPAPKVEAAPPQPAAVVVKSNIQPVAAIQTGTLAVSSPTTVDIYMNDQLVGSAPTTLVLPVGNQTLEYRHQDMRKSLTYSIKTNETTTAMVTFDVTVQINAKPWAQVFLDGSKRQPLGQTPLSDVRVPIGTELIFENPNFPGKSYRITGRETQVRVTFP